MSTTGGVGTTVADAPPRPSSPSSGRESARVGGTGRSCGASPPQPPLVLSSSCSFSIAEALREHRLRTATPADAGHPFPPDRRRPIDVVAVILAVSNLELVGDGGGGGGSVSLLIGDNSLPLGECARIVLRGGEATSAVLGGTMNVGDVFRFNRLTVRRDYCNHDLPGDEHGLPGDEGPTAAARLQTPQVRPRQASSVSCGAGDKSLYAPGESSALKKKEEGGGEGGCVRSSLATPAAASVAGRFRGVGSGSSGAKRLRVTPSPAVAAAARRPSGGGDDAMSASSASGQQVDENRTRRRRPPRPGWAGTMRRRQLPDVACEFGHSWLDPEAGPSFARLGYLSHAGGPITLTPPPACAAAAAASSAPSSSLSEEGEDCDRRPELASVGGDGGGGGGPFEGGAAVVLSVPDEVPIGMAVSSRLVRGLLDWYRHRRDDCDGRNREGSRVSPGSVLQQPQHPPRSIGAVAACGIVGGVNLRCQNRRRRRLRDALSSPNLLSDVVVRVDAFHHDGGVGSSAPLLHRRSRHRGRPNAPGASYAAISDGPNEEDQAVLVVAASAAVDEHGHAGRGGGGGGAAALAAALKGAAGDGEGELTWVTISAVLSRRASLASAVGPTDGGGGRDDLVLVPTYKSGLTRHNDGGGGAGEASTTTTSTPMPRPWPTHTPSLTMERAAAPTAFADSCPTPLGGPPSVVVLERREVRSRLVNVFIDDVGSSLVGGRGEHAITRDNLVRHIVEGWTAAPLATDAASTTTTGTDREEQRRFLGPPRYRGATLALDAAVPADCCVVKADGTILETLCGSVSPIELVEEAERRLDDVDACLLSEQVYRVLFGIISEEISLHWTIEKRQNDTLSGDGDGWHVIGASLKHL